MLSLQSQGLVQEATKYLCGGTQGVQGPEYTITAKNEGYEIGYYINSKYWPMVKIFFSSRSHPVLNAFLSNFQHQTKAFFFLADLRRQNWASKH
jgi:hypothetical protein